MEKPAITVLTASLNDWPSLKALLPLLDAALAEHAASVRVVCMDDGSSLALPGDLLDGHEFKVIDRVEIVHLLRNLGNQRALSIGMGWVARHVTCDWLVVMDCDHEDRPEVIPELLAAARAEGGAKIVFAARTERSESWLFKAFYAAYKRLYKTLTGMPISIGNFSVVPGRLVRKLAGVWEIGLHFPAGIMKARLPYASIGAARGSRLFGRTNMNLYSLVIHGFSGLAVHGEMVATRFILATLASSFLVMIYLAKVLFEKFFTDIPIIGWTSLIVSTFLGFLVQTVMLGLLLLFSTLNARMQRPVIPLNDHPDFIDTVSVFPTDRSRASAPAP
ncbi:hypothetical protein A6A04_03360 [Paramagnetospirillum marisnigri]|uniref:Glycosyltransferase 2-like domain-containing protein n=1 Tax=Paramagnetospirillum marisnigri TaxID=1285242 RepID=A0A178MM56_9PROT|nr:glycosyltransferase [Paramagnetospirillum marisnigri]OAN49165.1 hypothetical protein A6A04_03360 [Paramagnetospirillum marisnigri]